MGALLALGDVLSVGLTRMTPALVLLLIQGLDSFLLCFSQLLRCPHDIGASFSKSAQSTGAKEVSQCSLNVSPESHLPLLQLDTDANSMWDTTDIHRLEYHQRRLFESYLRGHPPYESVDISNYFWELKKKKNRWKLLWDVPSWGWLLNHSSGSVQVLAVISCVFAYQCLFAQIFRGLQRLLVSWSICFS